MDRMAVVTTRGCCACQVRSRRGHGFVRSITVLGPGGVPGPQNRRTVREAERDLAMSNVQMMRDLYDAFGRGDIATVLAAMDPGIEWREAEGNPYEPSDNKPWRGPGAVMQNLFARLATEWDGFTAHPREFYDAGSAVVVEGRYTGTYKQTGRKFDAQVCHVWTIRDGKITSFQQYVDTAQMHDVMGAP